MTKIIVANWKLNPASLAEAKKLAKASDTAGLVICPPFPFLEEVGKIIKKAELGAQDVFWEEKGAYTGEVSSTELKDVGVEYVIVGHSERRRNLGETDEMVAQKIAAAVKAGLKPILCVGESKEERAAGKTKEVVSRELKIGLSEIGNFPPEADPPLAEKFKIENFIVAYEPIWAIGTGVPDAPESTIEVIKLITQATSHLGIATKVIYGGSVTSKNAEDFLKHKEIEGALVGGASLNSEEIKKIVKIAGQY